MLSACTIQKRMPSGLTIWTEQLERSLNHSGRNFSEDCTSVNGPGSCKRKQKSNQRSSGRLSHRSNRFRRGKMNYLCPVCGFDGLDEPPYSFGGAGSFEICPSCDFQFGVTDDNEGISFHEWREGWMDRGMPWSNPGIPAPK
jgi:hypothetical protein